jgi:glycosyltransferase involved in cell wall biosynthesis
MTILAIHNYYQIRSGEDLAFEATVNVLRQRGHSVSLLTDDNQNISTHPAARIRLALTSFFSIRAFIRTWKEVSRSHPKVALVQNVFPLLSPSVYLALKLRGIPVVQRIFNYRLVCPNGILYTQGRICERCTGGANWNAVRFACYRKSRSASAVLAASLAIWRAVGLWRWGVKRYLTPDLFLGKKILPAVRDETKIRTVFNPAPISASHPLKRFSRESDVLFVGRLVREKGIFTLIKIAREMPDRVFQIIGSGEDAETARDQAQKAGLTNIRWKGPIYGSELDHYFERCGALVLPSEWYDNMPLVLTQALLSGIPIVASRINGIPEFAIEGETARLANPGDPHDFARRIREVFDDPERTAQLCEAGFRRASEWFMPERFGPALEQALIEPE